MSSSVGLYNIFLRRLNEIKLKSKKEIVPFPFIFEKLCLNFSITKGECWEILFLLRDAQWIEIVPFHGIKIING